MTTYEQMLSQYSSADRKAIYEVVQQIALAGLHRGGFFEHAAFYGGTCLRIFHGMKRFSEDMDFSLLAPCKTFRFEDYFPSIISEFEATGRHVEITKKSKLGFGKVESAFLKDSTDIYNISFQTEKSVKIKIEVDTCPPTSIATEQRLLLLPYSFMTRCYTLPCLFAGKMHALVYRTWRNRVKGRDWYDFEWYVRNNVPLNFAHLQERIRQFNGEALSKEDFLEALRQRLSSTNIQQVKEDVEPFIIDRHEMDIWSNDYFLQLANMIRFE